MHDRFSWPIHSGRALVGEVCQLTLPVSVKTVKILIGQAGNQQQLPRLTAPFRRTLQRVTSHLDRVLGGYGSTGVERVENNQEEIGRSRSPSGIRLCSIARRKSSRAYRPWAGKFCRIRWFTAMQIDTPSSRA